MADGLEDRVAAMQRLLGPLAAHRGGDQPGGGADRIDLGCAPVALALAVVEVDEAPPAAVDEDRDGQDREPVAELERLALVGGKVADVAREDIAASEHLGPAGEVGGRPMVGEPRVVDRRSASSPGPSRRAGPGEGHRSSRCDVLEHECSAGAGRLTELAHQLDDRLVEVRLREKALGRAADRPRIASRLRRSRSATRRCSRASAFARTIAS